MDKEDFEETLLCYFMVFIMDEDRKIILKSEPLNL